MRDSLAAGHVRREILVRRARRRRPPLRARRPRRSPSPPPSTARAERPAPSPPPGRAPPAAARSPPPRRRRRPRRPTSLSASTSATGCPENTTSSRASGSAARPVAPSAMGRSPAVSTATTPGSAERRARVDARQARMRLGGLHEPARAAAPAPACPPRSGWPRAPWARRRAAGAGPRWRRCHPLTGSHRVGLRGDLAQAARRARSPSAPPPRQLGVKPQRSARASPS